jgi:hypothetical protein
MIGISVLIRNEQMKRITRVKTFVDILYTQSTSDDPIIPKWRNPRGRSDRSFYFCYGHFMMLLSIQAW